MFKIARTYHYAILACKFVKVGRVGLLLFISSNLFIGVAKDVEVVVSKAVTNENIGNEFQG